MDPLIAPNKTLMPINLELVVKVLRVSTPLDSQFLYQFSLMITLIRFSKYSLLGSDHVIRVVTLKTLLH